MKEAEEIKALISLLDDPDTRIIDQVSEKLLSYGEKAIIYLENAWEKSLEEPFLSRVDQILEILREDVIKRNITDWTRSEAKDILEAAFIISQIRFPNIEKEEIFAESEKILKDLWLELNDELTALEKVNVLNHVLFTIYGFNPNIKNINHFDNHYINKVFKDKTGNPLTLGILYIHIAAKAGLPVMGVKLPEHFVLAYVNTNEEISFVDKNKVLFYINPFSKGTAFSRNEIETYLKKMKYPHNNEYFLPCTNIEVARIYLEQTAVMMENENPKLLKTDFINELDAILKQYV